jgi:hypothetical protein
MSSAGKRIPTLRGLKFIIFSTTTLRGRKFIIFSTTSSRIRWSDSGWSWLKLLVSYERQCAANIKVCESDTNHRHTHHLTFLIFRRHWGNVTCTNGKWKYERWIYGLWKILSDNLGVKSESLTWLVVQNDYRRCRNLIKTYFRLTSHKLHITENVFCTSTSQSIR